MHDDAPLHKEFVELLDTEFQRKWIGPGSTFATWPSLSPDIHPLCFFLWGHVKSKVYKKPIEENDVNDLVHRVYQAFIEITPDMLKHAVKAYKERLKMVLEANGNLIDHHNDEGKDKTSSDMETIAWLTRLEKGNFLR
uniref:Uncharacterized protein n=1 Tax=Acrobeloides nanus TaxID=290746 RepID=A0A914DNV9_9BILA